MKATLSLLLLTTSLALSAPTTSDMIKKNQEKLNLIFSNDRVLQKEIRSSRGERNARECRFCLRKIPITREIRIARISRETLYLKPINHKSGKIAIAH